MSAHPTVAIKETASTAVADPQQAALRKTMRNQRIQDFLFHKITLLFAVTVLLALVGIIVSLAIGAAPAFREFGPAFITTVEWDPVEDRYGALIAIWGTVA